MVVIVVARLETLSVYRPLNPVPQGQSPPFPRSRPFTGHNSDRLGVFWPFDRSASSTFSSGCALHERFPVPAPELRLPFGMSQKSIPTSADLDGVNDFDELPDLFPRVFQVQPAKGQGVPQKSAEKLKSALGDIVSVFARIEAIENPVKKQAAADAKEPVCLTPIVELRSPSDEEEGFDLSYDVEIRRLVAQGELVPEMAPVQLIEQEERSKPREQRYVLEIVTSRSE